MDRYSSYKLSYLNSLSGLQNAYQNKLASYNATNTDNLLKAQKKQAQRNIQLQGMQSTANALSGYYFPRAAKAFKNIKQNMATRSSTAEADLPEPRRFRQTGQNFDEEGFYDPEEGGYSFQAISTGPAVDRSTKPELLDNISVFGDERQASASEAAAREQAIAYDIATGSEEPLREPEPEPEPEPESLYKPQSFAENQANNRFWQNQIKQVKRNKFDDFMDENAKYEGEPITSTDIPTEYEAQQNLPFFSRQLDKMMFGRKQKTDEDFLKDDLNDYFQERYGGDEEEEPVIGRPTNVVKTGFSRTKLDDPEPQTEDTVMGLKESDFERVLQESQRTGEDFNVTRERLGFPAAETEDFGPAPPVPPRVQSLGKPLGLRGGGEAEDRELAQALEARENYDQPIAGFDRQAAIEDAKTNPELSSAKASTLEQFSDRELQSYMDSNVSRKLPIPSDEPEVEQMGDEFFRGLAKQQFSSADSTLARMFRTPQTPFEPPSQPQHTFSNRISSVESRNASIGDTSQTTAGEELTSAADMHAANPTPRYNIPSFDSKPLAEVGTEVGETAAEVAPEVEEGVAATLGAVAVGADVTEAALAPVPIADVVGGVIAAGATIASGIATAINTIDSQKSTPTPAKPRPITQSQAGTFVGAGAEDYRTLSK